MAYIGQNADGNFTTSVSKDTFSGNGSTTAFTLSEGATTNTVDVFVENIRQEPTTAYTVDGTTLTFTAAPVTGTNNIYVVNRGPIQLSASHPAAQALTAHSATITTDLTVDTNTLYVDSTNNRVGVGTVSPSQVLTVKTATDANFIALNDSGVRLQATNDAGTSLDTMKVTGNPLIFLGSGGAETARIDTSGNLLVGKTANSVSDAGLVLRGGGELFVTRAGDVANFNRLTSDGAIVNFRKDDTVVGSIGTSGGALFIGNDDAGIYFNDHGGGDLDSILPYDVGSGALYNGHVDIGGASNRFKNLYLSGSVYLGGTGSANALDDYEEGTWTATIGNGTVNANATRYVKIGQQVTVWGYLLTFSDRSTASAVNIGGLPFQSASDNFSSGVTFHRYINAGGDSVTTYIPQSTSTMTFYASNQNSGYTNVLHSQLSSTSTTIFFTATYRA